MSQCVRSMIFLLIWSVSSCISVEDGVVLKDLIQLYVYLLISFIIFLSSVTISICPDNTYSWISNSNNTSVTQKYPLVSLQLTSAFFTHLLTK